MRRHLVLPLTVAVALAALPGCSRIKYSQGYIVDETLLTAIQPGIDNRTSVERTLGRPTFTAQFDAREWYYVSRNSTQLAFLPTQPTTQSILIVRFDAKGVVEGVERRGLEKTAKVDPESDKTPTLGRESSLFEDIFGNIGAVGAAPGGVGDTAGRDGPR